MTDIGSWARRGDKPCGLSYPPRVCMRTFLANHMGQLMAAKDREPCPMPPRFERATTPTSSRTSTHRL